MTAIKETIQTLVDGSEKLSSVIFWLQVQRQPDVIIIDPHTVDRLDFLLAGITKISDELNTFSNEMFTISQSGKGMTGGNFAKMITLIYSDEEMAWENKKMLMGEISLAFNTAFDRQLELFGIFQTNL